MCGGSTKPLHLLAGSDRVCDSHSGRSDGAHCSTSEKNHNPEVQHVRKLNKLLRWVQRNAKKLIYRKLPSEDTHLRIVSDAAFKNGTEKMSLSSMSPVLEGTRKHD